MTIKELVLSIKDRHGELAQIVSHLYENDVNVRAFWVGIEGKKPTLRCITSNPEMAVSVLTGLGFEVTTADVIAAQVPDHPGGLNTILKILQSEGINIIHMYPWFETNEPVLILKVDRPEHAVRAFQDNWIRLYDDRLYHL